MSTHNRLDLRTLGSQLIMPKNHPDHWHKCSHTTGWIINSFILQTLIFHPLKFHPLDFFLDCPRNFVDRRMGRHEWMAWMWSAHKTTPFIHNALVTWRDYYMLWISCVFLYYWVEVYSIDTSVLFPEVRNFNRLFLNLHLAVR